VAGESDMNAKTPGQPQKLGLMPEHPMALGAQRLVNDDVVISYFNRLEENFTLAALQGPDAGQREQNRLQLLALYGLITTIRNFAEGQIPGEFREANVVDTNSTVQ